MRQRKSSVGRLRRKASIGNSGENGFHFSP